MAGHLLLVGTDEPCVAGHLLLVGTDGPCVAGHLRRVAGHEIRVGTDGGRVAVHQSRVAADETRVAGHEPRVAAFSVCFWSDYAKIQRMPSSRVPFYSKRGVQRRCSGCFAEDGFRCKHSKRRQEGRQGSQTMSQGDYLGRRDADLLAFSVNFDTRITASPTAVGLTAAQATAYTVLHDAFASALALVTGGANSTPNVVAKNQARVNLVSGPGGIRELVRIIQAFPGTTNTQRAELNITIPDVEPSPIPAPGFAPGVEIISVSGRTVRIRLKDTQSTRRGKPEGVVGATIITCISETEPTSSSNWKPQGNTSQVVVDLSFPETVESGAKVWISAAWLNPRMEAGPMSTPLSTNLPGGAEAQAA